MNKSPATIGIIITLVIGAAFLFGLIITQRDDIKSGSDIVVLAEKLGLDKDQFIADFESDEVKKIVEDQEQDGLNRLNGQASTPSIFINGEKFVRQTETDLIERLKVLDDESSEPVLVEVFEDYNCPACAQFQYSLYDVMQEFDSSEVDVQKKHLPFLKESSAKYARAAEAAKKQGAFEQYNIELFMMVQNKTFDFYNSADYPVSY